MLALNAIEHGTVEADIGTEVRECLVRTVVVDQFSQLSDGRIQECLLVRSDWVREGYVRDII